MEPDILYARMAVVNVFLFFFLKAALFSIELLFENSYERKPIFVCLFYIIVKPNFPQIHLSVESMQI